MAKRFNLREYQENMLVRLQEATATAQADARLGVEIGGRQWLVKLADVAEVLPVPNIAEVPLARPWLKGVANVRGNLMSVIDLQAFFNEGSQALSQLSRILLIQPRHLPHASILVGRMLGIRHSDAMTVTPLPADVPAWITSTYKDDKGQVWQELDIEHLVNDPAFLQTGIIA
ncbi:twitching motility protein PilI [Formivibrio citricus]|uniref:Twitching motility protein PilI n=1 Tax=Formivibrio citricus TaxID=83765 RepID=A0A1I4X1Y5_9NEIS|nr:chemotaxis protein CheW [Formivibrio citricus]SFN19239.1 twitching motility protein PilI [Formivibrio citricus]